MRRVIATTGRSSRRTKFDNAGTKSFICNILSHADLPLKRRFGRGTASGARSLAMVIRADEGAGHSAMMCTSLVIHARARERRKAVRALAQERTKLEATVASRTAALRDQVIAYRQVKRELENPGEEGSAHGHRKPASVPRARRAGSEPSPSHQRGSQPAYGRHRSLSNDLTERPCAGLLGKRIDVTRVPT